MKKKELIVVLGLDDKNKPHAAKFDVAQGDAVYKAAKVMGFQSAVAKSEDAFALADRLPPGRLFATGKGMIAFCKSETYAALRTSLGLGVAADIARPAKTDSSATAVQIPDKKAAPSLDDAYAALQVGDKVIAPERKPADDGWWPCVITAASKDGKTITLRWLDNPKQPSVTLKRRAVALLPQ